MSIQREAGSIVRICFYMPFKPLGHLHPSGDLIIGTELFQFLQRRGHDVRLVSRLRTRWIYWKPWQWLRLPGDIVFAIGAVLMAVDFIVKLRPFIDRKSVV